MRIVLAFGIHGVLLISWNNGSVLTQRLLTAADHWEGP